MFVYFNMPPMEKWDPKKAITIWINDKKRREHIDIIQKETAKKQSYFEGIFESASTSTDIEDEEKMEEKTIETSDKNIKF